jgi:hypothetical protein
MVAGRYCKGLLTFTWSVQYFHSPANILLTVRQLSLFLYDVLQAMGGILDIRWANNGIVTIGSYCTAQGTIQQIGELGVALITLVCAFLAMLTSRNTNLQLTRFLLSIHLWWLCGE